MKRTSIRYHNENLLLIQRNLGVRTNRAVNFYWCKQVSKEMNRFVDACKEILNEKK